MTLLGSCACKAITFTLEDEPKTFHACHCDTCRAWSGGVVLSIHAGKGTKFNDPNNRLTIWKSSDWAERGFCSLCGSSLFYRLTIPGPMNGDCYVCPGGLEDWKDMKLNREMFSDCRPSGYCFKTEGEHIEMTRAQVEAQFASADNDTEKDSSTGDKPTETDEVEGTKRRKTSD